MRKPITLLFFALISSACGDESAPPDAPPTSATDPVTPPASPPATPDAAESTCESVLDVTQWQPRSWPEPTFYEMAPDPTRAFCNKPGIHIRSLVAVGDDASGTLMGLIAAEPWRDKRIRLRAKIETSNVRAGAALFVKMGKGNAPLARSEKLTGTLPSTPSSIVVDVPSDAKEVFIGVFLQGPGEVWAESVLVEVVTKDVPLSP